MKNLDPTIAAANAQGKSMFHIRTVDGVTVDLVPVRQAAFAYVLGLHDPHLYEVYERTPLGALRLILRPKQTRYQLVDLISKLQDFTAQAPGARS